MFTGIIQEIGKIISTQSRDGNLVLTVSSSKLSGRLQIVSSIAINGACQTVTDIKKESFTVEAISETLEKGFRHSTFDRGDFPNRFNV